MNLCVCIKKVGCPIKKKGGGGNVGQGVDALKRGDWNPLKNYGYQSHMFTSTTDRTHAKIFCQSSQKRCKEKTRKGKRGNCKAFCVTSNCNKERAMFSNLKK